MNERLFLASHITAITKIEIMDNKQGNFACFTRFKYIYFMFVS